MRLFNILSEFEISRLSELDVPMPGAAATPGAIAAPGAVQATQDPQAAAKMQAQQALDRMNQKKQIQDAIKQKQQELQDLQKQLAQIK
jgi:phage-related minor tail protein